MSGRRIRHDQPHVAKAAGIDHVAAEMTDMIGAVDAVLLARDDPEHHRAMAEPFIDADCADLH